MVLLCSCGLKQIHEALQSTSGSCFLDSDLLDVAKYEIAQLRLGRERIRRIEAKALDKLEKIFPQSNL